MLQDLSRTELWLWTDNAAGIVTPDTLPFFLAFEGLISIKVFDYAEQVAGTPLEGHAYFGSEAAIKASLPQERRMAVYSDLVRYLLLHNHGGLWCAPLAALLCVSLSCCCGGPPFPACTDLPHGSDWPHGRGCPLRRLPSWRQRFPA